MTRLLCLALLATMASSADAIESGKTWISVADGTISMNPTGTDNSSALVVLDNQPTIKGPILGSYTASTLPTGVAGQIAWCSDCYETDPCIGDANGTGAFARRDAGAWKCSTPTKLHVATFCTSQAGAGNTCSSSSTWDKANIKFTAKNVTIRCMGGGGGGGAGGVAATSTGGTGGGGGAGGTYCQNTFDYDAMPSTLTVMVGSKGNGATTANLVGLSAANTIGNQGGPGNPSYVYDTSQGNCTTSGTCLAYCYANGGFGGSGGIGSTITGTSGSPGAATTSARPWGNYAGGIGQGTGTGNANVPCKNAGPFLPDSNGLNGSSCSTGGSVVLPYGTATYAAGSGGGGGFAGSSSTTGTTGGTGGRSAHTLGAAGGAASTAALGAQGGTAGSSFGHYYGVNLFPGRAGGGGGGGGGRNSGAPGNGGAGGYPGGGGGGGGGGAIGTGNRPGAGGDGADGYCQIITTG